MLVGLRGQSGVSFIRTRIPSLRAPPSWPYYLPKAPLPNTTALGIGFQHMDLSETQTLSVVVYFLCWTRLQRACVEARYHSFDYLEKISLFSLKLPLPLFLSPYGHTLRQHLSFSRQWLVSPGRWEGRPQGAEIHLAGKAAVMLSPAALGSKRMKEMSSHIPKILSTCLFQCQVPAIYYVRLGHVLGLSKRLMGYLMFILWGLTKGFLTQKMHGTHHMLWKTKAGPILWFVFWTISVWNRRAETIKSYLWLSVTSTWWSF